MLRATRDVRAVGTYLAIMALDIDILLLGPFRDVIARAEEAVANATKQVDHDHDPELCELMLKSSQALLREGERALKRIQPLWNGQVEKYGGAFADGWSQNGRLTFCTNIQPHPSQQH